MALIALLTGSDETRISFGNYQIADPSPVLAGRALSCVVPEMVCVVVLTRARVRRASVGVLPAHMCDAVKLDGSRRIVLHCMRRLRAEASEVCAPRDELRKHLHAQCRELLDIREALAFCRVQLPAQKLLNHPSG